MHAVIDRHPKHGIHFRVLAKVCVSPVVTSCTPAPWSASLRATVSPPSATSTNCANPSFPKIAAAVTSSTKIGSMGGVFAVASGGIHVWHMPALVSIFGDDSVLQFGGGTHGHPWAAAGAAANRVALEACVKARNAGREIEREGRDILMEAAKHSPELAIALETWKEIKFEFDTVDKLDVN